MSGARFTAWLSGPEREAIRKVAAANHCSENLVIRYAVRAMLFNESVALRTHRESCTIFADDPRTRKLGCTCDLGHTSNTNNTHQGATA